LVAVDASKRDQTEQRSNKHMNKFTIATATAVALIASVGAASAQTWQNDGYNGRGRTMIDRNVGLQTGHADEMYAEPSSNRGWMRQRDGSTFESRAFRSQEVWPQSPPTGY
jgi:opacity protein-like surface antigen